MRKLTDKNRLSIVYPKLCKEWDYAKNQPLKPEDVSFGSHIRAWWKCKHGHSWKTQINYRHDTRRKGLGCPYCSGHKVNKENCLLSSPSVAKEWNYAKNIGINPEDFTTGSNKTVWWICFHGHEWKQKINSRKTNGCPYCSNQKVCEDNCLASINPTLAKEWHPTKNGKLTPYDVGPNTGRKTWWICKHGHEYCSRVIGRNVFGYGCPYCSSVRVSRENSLLTLAPKLSKQWHPTKNGKLNPANVTAYSRKKAWWICSKKHEWRAAIGNRSANGTGCPFCGKILLKDGTSFDSVTEAYFYLKHLKLKYKTIKFNSNYGLGKRRYDFYIPKINTYIEVTSFNKNARGKSGIFWKKYYKKIMEKKKYVNKILKANFVFIHLNITKEQVIFVRNNSI